ncbi:T-cell surface glycoprotein CD3 zeta chain [Menidia menidia]
MKRFGMKLRTVRLLLTAAMLPSAGALQMYDPQLCYLLDGLLGLYGLLITGMFLREKFFKAKGKATLEESLYTDLRGQDSGGYSALNVESGKGRTRRPQADHETYTGLQNRVEGQYKELPLRAGNRHRKNDPVYQGLSPASRDTYDSLQMQQLPAR